MLKYSSDMEFDLRLLKEPYIEETGILGVLDSPEMPFLPKRLYWIHSVPPGSTRGNHAHKKLRQFFWLVKGTVDIELSDGTDTKSLSMNENKELLVISPGLWRKLHNFSDDAVVMVGADASYNPQDYIYSWQEFLIWRNTPHED
jgi:dTDP-4-dehydrorhamnose 3,5-epimerase-like enzyme